MRSESAVSWAQRRICAVVLRRAGRRTPRGRRLGYSSRSRGLAHVRGVVVAAPYLC
eukprot:COSAG03_NODE_24089_length_275_cov_0.522727_1_plen_55_part_10